MSEVHISRRGMRKVWRVAAWGMLRRLRFASALEAARNARAEDPPKRWASGAEVVKFLDEECT